MEPQSQHIGKRIRFLSGHEGFTKNYFGFLKSIGHESHYESSCIKYCVAILDDGEILKITEYELVEKEPIIFRHEPCDLAERYWGSEDE